MDPLHLIFVHASAFQDDHGGAVSATCRRMRCCTHYDLHLLSPGFTPVTNCSTNCCHIPISCFVKSHEHRPNQWVVYTGVQNNSIRDVHSYAWHQPTNNVFCRTCFERHGCVQPTVETMLNLLHPEYMHDDLSSAR